MGETEFRTMKGTEMALLTIKVELDVDLDDYALAYGMTPDEAEADAMEHLPYLVANTLVPSDRHNKSAYSVGAEDAGVTLVGELAELVDQ